MKQYNGVTITTTKGNQKLGANVISTYRSVGITCPSDCPFLNNGCYAQKHKQGIIQKLANNSIEVFNHTMQIVWAKVLRKRNKPTLVRFHTSGDVMKNNYPDKQYIRYLLSWAEKYKLLGMKIINYTHAWKHDYVNTIQGFTRASTHSIEEAQNAIKNGWHVVMSVPKKGVEEAKKNLADVGLTGVHCPNQTHKITCSQCKLCAVKGSQSTIIIFEKH